MGKRLLYLEYLDKNYDAAIYAVCYAERSYTIFTKRIISRDKEYHLGETRWNPWTMVEWKRRS